MQSLGLMIHDAARLLKGEFERRTRDKKLTLTQWRVLVHLAKDEGLTQTTLAQRLEASAMTMSDVLDRLETAGYVRREPDPSDSRAKLVWITDKARELVGEMRHVADEVYDKALAGISAADREALVRAMSRLTQNLDPAATKRKEPVE